MRGSGNRVPLGQPHRKKESPRITVIHNQKKKGEMKRMEATNENQHLCVTPGVAEKLHPEEVGQALAKHRRGESIALEGKHEKNDSRPPCELGRRLSVHRSGSGDLFWIVSELDPPFITVTLPSEY